MWAASLAAAARASWATSASSSFSRYRPRPSRRLATASGPQRDRHVVAVEAVQTADDLVGLEAMTFQTGGSCAHVQVSLRYPAEMLGMLMRPLLVSMSFRMLAILGTASIRAMPGRGTAGLLPVFFLGSWSPAAIVSVYADRHT